MYLKDHDNTVLLERRLGVQSVQMSRLFPELDMVVFDIALLSSKIPRQVAFRYQQNDRAAAI